ncbi:malto-oligosyltrehalose synthase [Nocardioides perillae]|uniref:(1->4)-alpha-D-glucan 1-alpha-D-glucosylmutase n=1 Tax=Nocardioides perillae TaxID=1119534 RepID=A0A7Y9RPW0_9ACTN|nr:(1->4)-alpha-D-glucan 1-alpha-D-glucosylmutase [Nocardioides perillae]
MSDETGAAPRRTRQVPARVPTSTYRLQVTPAQDLFRCAEVLPYLRDLGADWVYLSPILASEPGSDHGYDVVAHDHVDEERGGEAGLAALAATARELGLGVLVDIVPNHVGVATPVEDPWWWDVLKHGRDAEHAAAFDVDWSAGDGRLRIPVVGDHDLPQDAHGAGATIGHLAVVVDDESGEPELRYHDHRFPVAPGTADDLGEPLPEGTAEPGAVVDADTVHDRQHYELVNWHDADDDLNYRRFFAVNTLAALRVEDPEVFRDTHREIGRWISEGLVDGLRVDHPDGLRDPKGYLDDLAELTGGAYVLVEKILEPGEHLPVSWACEGTTGYDALGLLDRVLVDPAGEEPLDALETRLRGGPVDWPEMVHDLKREVTDGILHAEVRRIGRELRRHLPTLPAHRVEDVVAELLACFPVYRSYLPEGRDHLEEAVAEARHRRPDLAATFDQVVPWLTDPDAAAAKRFQQTSGMVMAKGVEDCSFYRWSRLTSLTEVGADPADFAVSVDELHAALTARQRDWPHAMTTTSTHDTKRGEDTRARISVLAEVPDVWAVALDRLQERAPVPDPGFGSLLWQAAVGAWPVSRERLHAYAEKAMREAGAHTRWTEPDEAFEGAVHAAVDAAYDDEAVAAEVAALARRLAGPGWVNSLSLKLLALTAPGVPDVYQGSELWEQSLVDPDNRRPVDFEARRALLDRVADGWVPPLTTGDDALDDDGAAKLAVVRAALRLRRDRPELFTDYTPVAAQGEATDHVVAFDRGGAVAVATRLPVGLARRGGWGDTSLDLPEGAWVDEVTGRRLAAGPGGVPLAELLADLPVALLRRDS